MLHPLLVLFVLLTVLTGLVYPMVVTGIGKLVFPHQASGSRVEARVNVLMLDLSLDGVR